MEYIYMLIHDLACEGAKSSTYVPMCHITNVVEGPVVVL